MDNAITLSFPRPPRQAPLLAFLGIWDFRAFGCGISCLHYCRLDALDGLLIVSGTRFDHPTLKTERTRKALLLEAFFGVIGKKNSTDNCIFNVAGGQFIIACVLDERSECDVCRANLY